MPEQDGREGLSYVRSGALVDAHFTSSTPFTLDGQVDSSGRPAASAGATCQLLDPLRRQRPVPQVLWSRKGVLHDGVEGSRQVP